MSNTGRKKIGVIGAGFAGLAAAASVAKEGHEVLLFDKNDQLGGRAKLWKSNGFTFDMGPSWYWMPEVFENFYQKFGHTQQEFYDLKRLSPSYRVYFGADDFMDVPANDQELLALFESLEEGSAKKLEKFLAEAKYKYDTGMNDFVWRPSHSILEFAEARLVPELFRINLLGSVSKEVRSLFKHPKLIKLLEFPVLFLGATPQNTPGLYSLMNYADLVLGTWYPMGGMHEIVKAMGTIAQEQGVTLHLKEAVITIDSNDGKASSIKTEKGVYEVDGIIAAADYAHVDQKLLSKETQNYTANYWDKRTLSPSSLLFYIGVNKRLKNLLHHNLFFDEDFALHAEEIYTNPKWPTKPLFYASCPSVTDSSLAPAGHENLFLLVPLAPGLKDSDEMREKYYNIIMDRLEALTKDSIREHVILKRSYAMQNFEEDYNSYKGNAYGLANTLGQTAFLKPKMRSKHLKNLFFAGQLTVPGPGVPPSIISGQVASAELLKSLK